MDRRFRDALSGVSKAASSMLGTTGDVDYLARTIVHSITQVVPDTCIVSLRSDDKRCCADCDQKRESEPAKPAHGAAVYPRRVTIRASMARTLKTIREPPIPWPRAGNIDQFHDFPKSSSSAGCSRHGLVSPGVLRGRW